MHVCMSKTQMQTGVANLGDLGVERKIVVGNLNSETERELVFSIIILFFNNNNPNFFTDELSS